MPRWLMAFALVASFVAAPSPSWAKIITYYTAAFGTQVRQGPGDHHPVVYTLKKYDNVRRVGKTTLYGRTIRGSVDGRPKCSSGWCEVLAGSGNYGFIPVSALEKKSYDDKGYNIEDDPFFADFF